MRRLRSWSVLALGALAALVAAPAALAGTDPSSSVYAGVAGNVQGGIAGASPSGGALPFTGLNLALIVVGGLALIATGVLLRRRSAAGR